MRLDGCMPRRILQLLIGLAALRRRLRAHRRGGAGCRSLDRLRRGHVDPHRHRHRLGDQHPRVPRPPAVDSRCASDRASGRSPTSCSSARACRSCSGSLPPVSGLLAQIGVLLGGIVAGRARVGALHRRTLRPGPTRRSHDGSARAPGVADLALPSASSRCTVLVDRVAAGRNGGHRHGAVRDPHRPARAPARCRCSTPRAHAAAPAIRGRRSRRRGAAQCSRNAGQSLPGVIARGARSSRSPSTGSSR